MTPIEELEELIASNLARDPHFYDAERPPVIRSDRAGFYFTPDEMRASYGSNSVIAIRHSFGSNTHLGYGSNR